MADSPNPFKPDDKVLTKVKGEEVEATVRVVWKDEVQVRTADGALKWRTVKTVWLPAEGAAEPNPESLDPGATQSTGGNLEENESIPVEAPDAENTSESAEAIEGASAEVSDATPAIDAETAGEVTEITTPPAPDEAQKFSSTLDAHLEYGPCGVPETMAQRKRNRKGGRRK